MSEQGDKYGVEAVKALLALNGGAAVALLAFWGARQSGAGAALALPTGNALLGFGIGALLAALAPSLKYFGDYVEGYNLGGYFSYLGHLAGLGSIICFCIGLAQARTALMQSVGL